MEEYNENELALKFLILTHLKFQENRDVEIRLNIGESTNHIEDDLCRKYKVGDVIKIKPNFGDYEFTAKILKINYNFVYITNRLDLDNYRLEKTIYSFDLENQSEVGKGEVVENVHISVIQ